MIKKFYIYLLSFSLVIMFSTNSFAGSKGPATKYIVTMTKAELCEKGSTISNCLNPVLISPAGQTKDADIAAASAGATVGSFGSLSKAKLGTEYTFAQVTMSRLFTLNGRAADGCGTGGTAGGVNAYGVGVASSTNTGDQVLSVPNTVGMNATLGNNMNGAADANASSVSANGVVSNSDTHMQFRQAFTGSLIIKSGVIPTMKIAFGTDLAIESQANGGSCTNAILNVAEPNVTMSFE